MLNILELFSGSKFPKTEKYENEHNLLVENYDRFTKIENSEGLKRFKELDILVNSGDFEAGVKKLKKEKFKDTETFHQYKNFKESKRSKNVKKYNKYLIKNDQEKLQELADSAEIKRYLELKAYVESKEFNDIKEEVTDKKRFQKSKEYQLIEEYKTLQKSEDIIWYSKTKKANLFDDLNKWKLTFEDDFNSPKLDESKWITGYFWGKALMNENYVQANEKQFFKHENIELRDSCARIISKKESCKGKVWDPSFGFVPQTFDFSSGIISTGQSFRQQFGRFEAKIKFNHTFPAAHTFWLLAEQMSPQINILKSPEKDKNKIEVGNFWIDNKTVQQKVEKLKIPGEAEEFYVYTLDWTKDKLEWKINGVTVHTQTQNIPQTPMYISFSTHFTDVPDASELPISMDIDWIRCYQLN